MRKTISHKNHYELLTISEIDDLLISLRDSKKMENQELFSTTPISVQQISRKIEDVTNQFQDIFYQVEIGHGIPIDEIQEEIIPIIRQAAEIPHLHHLFYELNSKDKYTYLHTICVGIIATTIGKWLGLSPQDLSNLTLGATLHDIGKTRVPTHLLNKPGKLTQEEYEEMKLHTIHGYELIRDIEGLSESVALIAVQHHEREDGKGYPLGLVSDQIHPLSKIVAIADVFHAMSSSRSYRNASPFYEVMNQMQKDAFGKFDSKVMLVFLNKMMNSLVGKKVILTDNTVGSIIMINPYDPIRCLVMVGKELIDLRYNQHLQIQKIIEDS